MVSEKRKQQMKEYQQKNKGKRLQYMKQYQKEWFQTPEGKKSNTISQWKKQKIIFHDWDLLYDIIYTLTSHCDHCNVFLQGLGNDRKCIDHDHSITDRDNVRNVLCCRCNIKRG